MAHRFFFLCACGSNGLILPLSPCLRPHHLSLFLSSCKLYLSWCHMNSVSLCDCVFVLIHVGLRFTFAFSLLFLIYVQQLLGDSALFMHYSLLFVHYSSGKKILKMSHTVLFTHLKIILLQCFQFSISAKISCIQTDTISFKLFFRVLKLFNFLCPIVLPLFLSPCPKIASLFLCFFPRFLDASLSSIASLFLFPCMLSF